MVGMDPLAELARYGGDVSTVGASISAGVDRCICDRAPGGVMGRTGVEDGVTGGTESAGVLLPATMGGTGDVIGAHCCGNGLRCVGLSIVLGEWLMPPWDGGLKGPDDDRDCCMLSGIVTLSAFATAINRAAAVG